MVGAASKRGQVRCLKINDNQGSRLRWGPQAGSFFEGESKNIFQRN